MTGRVRCRRCGWSSPVVADRTAPYWIGSHAVASGCPVGEIVTGDGGGD